MLPFTPIIPGKIDTCLIHVSHKGAGIEAVVIIVPQDKDIVEIIEFVLIQPESQLDGGGADQDGHFGSLFHFDIVEIFGMLKKPGAEEEFPLFFETQTGIIPEVTGHDGVIEGLAVDKTFELMPGVETLNEHSYRAIKEQDSQYQ